MDSIMKDMKHLRSSRLQKLRFKMAEFFAEPICFGFNRGQWWTLSLIVLVVIALAAVEYHALAQAANP